MTRIFVPNDTSACSLGADAVAAAIATQLHHLKLDAQLIRNGSRGAYWAEPLVEVETETGRIGFANLTEASAYKLFFQGIPDANDPQCLGIVEHMPWLKQQQRISFARVGIDDPLNFAAFTQQGGLRGLRRALSMTASEVVNEISASGLRGRGGAAFPAGIKWQTVLNAVPRRAIEHLSESMAADERSLDQHSKYVICNADEGDSGTFADRLLLEADPFQLIEGMCIAGITLGATAGVIYLRSEYPKAHAVLQQALIIARQQGLLGASVLGSPHSFTIELRLGAGAYVCGDETSLMESIEGRRGLVRAKPPLPAVAGLFGQPTLVHNVLSLAAVTSILADGAPAYAQHGTTHARGTMPFQLGGNVARGGVIELPFGVPLRILLEQFGQGSRSGRPLRAVQVGGPFGAYLPSLLWDTPLDYESLTAINGLLGHGGIVAFDDSVDMVEQAEFAMSFCAHESCGKCTPCRIGSVRGVEIIQRMRKGEARQGDFALLKDLCDTLESGSLCALGGLTPLPVRSAFTHFREDWRSL